MQGLIVSSRKDSLQHFKQPWAHEHEPVKGLLDAVKVNNTSLIEFLYSLHNFCEWQRQTGIDNAGIDFSLFSFPFCLFSSSFYLILVSLFLRQSNQQY